MAEPLYPLLFEPHLAERPWGGDALHTVLDKSLPVGKKIGESWEIYSDNVIANGALAGRTLRDVLLCAMCCASTAIKLGHMWAMSFQC